MKKKVKLYSKQTFAKVVQKGLYNKKVKQEGHICSINDPRLRINIRCNSNKYFTISIKNPVTKCFFRNKYDLFKEKRRHLEQNTFVIHPLSRFSMTWCIILMICYIVSLFVIPLEILSLLVESTCNMDVFRLITLIVDFMGILDIMKSFFTGIATIKTQTILLKRKHIAKQYLKTYQFYIDFITCLPITALLMRLKRLFVIIHRYAVEVASDVYNLVVCIVLMFVWLHWTACLLPALPLFIAELQHTDISKQSWLSNVPVDMNSLSSIYAQSFFWTTAMFLCVRHTGLEVIDPMETVLMSCFYLCGYIGCAFLFVFFLQLVESFGDQSLKYEAMTNQLSKYMSYRQLSLSLQEKMLIYYEHKSKSIYFREGKLMSVLSDQLRKEINLFSYVTLMKSVNILHRISDKAVQEIVANLKAELFLPGDVITKAGMEADCMYFLSFGTVAIFTPMGKEICHYSDGSYFGEIELMLKDNKRICSVIAIEICEVYRLERRDFLRVMENEVETYRYLEKVALDRATNTAFLEELHKKHILERNMAVNYNH
ncbi:potassium/sodium hyperpolarization-activated cyclic nucleotide-gated channel 2-like isoform X2 [Onthophagus taurus]|uniref:potassium/sodium hyperpolarization-activated cyclic nucleotide-gated channel 2-like isoform X2 n=1 Tax=Onthophagus taurus TaxID=166361 RepID=UPI0039BEA33B